jgi:hypothetical protein
MRTIGIFECCDCCLLFVLSIPASISILDCASQANQRTNIENTKQQQTHKPTQKQTNK